MSQELIQSTDPLDLEKIIRKHNFSRVFLVTGKDSYVKSGAKKYISNLSDEFGMVQFSDFTSNPKYEDSIKGIELFNNSECDVIVVIGGGSVIDMAKVIGAFALENKSNYIDILTENKKKNKPCIPIVAIPTTSGTGSEATHFAVVYYENKKYSLADTGLLPIVAILNTNLVLNQSQYLKACTGLDALAQSIESIWSVKSTNISVDFALEALELLINNLEKSVFSTDIIYNKNVAFASYLAGKAINITKTTGAHALSYGITTQYNIPHGHAVFFTLPAFMQYNYQLTEENCNDHRGVAFVKSKINKIFDILEVENSIDARKKLQVLAKNIGVDISFKNIGVGMDEMDSIYADINEQRLKNNPKKLYLEEFSNILMNM